ncbi:cytochrome [Bacillus pseudomycoides]|uniref:cytochrome n=1 Tax=Bacillus pseudomycoides TaxID=64104 RepID=UPI003D201AF7
MIANLESRIQQITDELLDAVQKKGKMDLIADFAFPFQVIAEMLGIPVLYQEKIYDLWVSIKADPNQDHHAWIKEYYSCFRETLEEK